ncbi:hypothetical protein PVAP13_1NG061000 [Panicum virgatum]|uniref:Uncharacterized protein n=1 Tax=Panicum virgatum TaxID=38727 RepID=A0A8T0WII9_PANVG|nr:hypothetical protein PVAP13_1NG061000 [Panicum virgatum]
MASASNNDAALDAAVAADHHGGAARRGRGGGFPRLPYCRLRAAAVCFTVWGAAGILSTTVPSIAGNPHEAMVYFILFIVGVLLLLLLLLLLLSVAAPGDLP